MQTLSKCPFCNCKLWIEPFTVDMEFENENVPYVAGYIVVDPLKKINDLHKENNEEREKTKHGEILIEMIGRELKEK